MRTEFQTKALEWAKVAALLLLAAFIGVGVAIASSPASFR